MESGRAALDLYRLIDGYKVTQAIHVAAVLGIADHIAAGACTSEAIADAAGADPDALYRLLRALASIGVLHEDEHRCFSLAPMGESLRSDAAHPLRPFAILTGQDYYWRTWGQLLHSVRTGENAFRAVHGVGSWTYREQHPDQNAIFNAAMTANSRLVNASIVDAIGGEAYARIADIGGGQGALLTDLLHARPTLRAVLFDRPSVVAEAVPLLAAGGVADRCDAVGGDMFDAVPAGCDAYVLKFIVHDWDDGDAVRILGVCRRAMAPGAEVLVIERIVGRGPDALRSTLSDLNMLVGPGGRERTLDEYATLFEAAGLRLDRVMPTASGLSVMVGAAA